MSAALTFFDSAFNATLGEAHCAVGPVTSPSPLQSDVRDRLWKMQVDLLSDDAWVSLTRSGEYRQLVRSMLGQAQSSATGFSLALQAVQPAGEARQAPTEKGSPDALLRLVERWLAEDDGYDADAWPVIKEDIEEYRLSNRRRTDE